MSPLLAALLALAAEAPAPAPSPSPEAPVRVGSEVVTVVATPILLSSTLDPGRGSVVSVGREQIEQLDARDLASALRRLPGVVISRYDAVGSYGGADGGGLFVRGMGSGRPGAEASTLVDGVPKVAAVWTHPLLDTLSVDLVERLDVYKGAQPVLLGDGSFFGVNLVPRQRAEPGFGGRLTAAYGRFDTSTLAAEASGRSGRLDGMAALSQRRSDGHRPGSSGRTRAGFARLGADLGRGFDLSLLVDATSGQADDPGAEGASPAGVVPRFETGDVFGLLALTRRHGEHEGVLKLSLEDGDIDWLQWDATRHRSFRTFTDWTNWGLRARDSFGLGRGGTLTVGLDWTGYGGRSREEWPAGTTELGDFRFQGRSAYASWARAFGARVKVTPSAGLRLHDSRELGWHWGAEAGLQVSGGFGTAQVRFARAFNLPGVWTAVLYRSYGRGDEWRSLGPEVARHLELAWQRPLGRRAHVTLSAFRYAVGDALRFVPPPPPPSFANLGSCMARGLEASVTFAPRQDLSLVAGGTLADTEPGKVPYTPGATVVAGLAWAPGPWRLSLDAQGLGSRFAGNLRYPAAPAEVDGFFLLNGRLARRLTSRGTEAWLSGENLTGAEYRYRPGYPMPGRSVSAGLGWGF